MEKDNRLFRNEKDLLRLVIKDGTYWISNCLDDPKNKKTTAPYEIVEEDWENTDQSVWLVIKTFKAANSSKPGYEIETGDLLKLGRVKFRVRELMGEQISNPNNQKDKANKDFKRGDTANNDKSMMSNKSNGKNGLCCRICLSESSDVENPLFSPCSCSGTMKFVHVECLQHWMKSKLTVKVNANTTSIYWKTLECELCKKPFPSNFLIGNRRYELIHIDKPENSAFMVLEILSKEKNVSRGVHIIKMNSNSVVRLGRGHDSDIRITDISVSRCHALIKFHQNKFYLEDNNSKFGTLIHIGKPLHVTGEYNNVSVQIGRTVVSLATKKYWNILPACMSGNKDGYSSDEENDDAPEMSPKSERHQPNSPQSISINNNNSGNVQLPPPQNNNEDSMRPEADEDVENSQSEEEEDDENENSGEARDINDIEANVPHQ